MRQNHIFRRLMNVFSRRLLPFFFLFLIIFTPAVSLAANCDEISCDKDSQSEDDYLDCNKEKQACLEEKIKETQGQAITLTNTISIINGQIALQQLQIDQTLAEINGLEKDIQNLTERINGLSLSLDRLSQILIEEVNIQYKHKANPYFELFLAVFKEKSFSDFILNYHYLKKAKQVTAQTMRLAESQRLNYHDQKTLKEEKQQELEEKQVVLQQQQNIFSQQKKEQQYLLNETKNNETRYQQELAKTLNELAAIQSIIAGQGDESEVREVKNGETIASIIAGPSACSTGTHLHFEVVKDEKHRDPAGYLKNVTVIWDNQPDSSFSFTGSWDWPVSDPARITQGYGMTYYARVKRYYGGAPHTGIDMLSKGGSLSVKAVKEGTLYRGSIKCGSGYLRYVKVEHQDGEMSTYYLHINY